MKNLARISVFWFSLLLSAYVSAMQLAQATSETKGTTLLVQPLTNPNQICFNWLGLLPADFRTHLPTKFPKPSLLIKPQLRPINRTINNLFFFWLFLALLTAVISHFTRNALLKKWYALSNFSKAKELLSEKKGLFSPIGLVFLLNYFVFGGYFLVEMLPQEIAFFHQHALKIGFGALVLVSIGLFKHFFYYLLGIVLGFTSQTRFYMRLYWLHNQTLGFLFLCIWLFAFQQDKALVQAWTLFAGFMVIFLLILRYIKAAKYFLLANSVQPFHFLLYFCAFEIIPILLLFKLALHV